MAKKAKTPAAKKNASAAAAKEPSTPPEDAQAASEASERAEPIVGMKRTYFLSNFPMAIGHDRMKTTVANAGFRRGRIWA
jgi:hypothetical protein